MKKNQGCLSFKIFKISLLVNLDTFLCRKNAVTLGDHFDCPMTSSKDMVECLRKIPTEKLHEAHVDLYFHWHKDSTERSPMNVFSPRSDPEAGPESFLPHHPHVAMKKGKFNPN